MKSLPLKTKLFTIVLSAIVLLALILTWRSYSGIFSLTNKLSEHTEVNLTQSVVNHLKVEVDAYSDDIGSYINAAYLIPTTMRSIIEANIRNGKTRLSREQLSNMFGQVLRANPTLSSTYAQFEHNGYDGNDDEYLNTTAIHSSEKYGSLELYWIREQDGSITQIRIDPDDKYKEDVNEFGIRTSEWYLCARDTKKPCLMEPYLYEIRPGYQELMTSLTTPIVVNNRFLGITGADINLPILGELTQKLSNSLYSGAGKATLVSSLGLIVASSHFNNHQMRPVKEAIADIDPILAGLKQNNGVFMTADTIYVIGTIPVHAAESAWTLLVELPKKVALAELHELETLANNEKNKVIGSQIIIGLILAIASMGIITLLILSITKPINELNKQVKQLASADGDLSKRIVLDTHAELISLSGNFNRFIEKLRTMVISLKDVSSKVRDESAENLKVSEQTREATDQQQHEIDNVVTATQEMSATAQEVARIASEVAVRTKDIHVTVTESQQNLSQTVETVLELGNNMHTASDSISKVSARSDDINRILVVIRSIAEQTNLLALNAAIEAARAGEQGRGFAVVADEVRTLASRTQTSTEEINSMIASLQSEVKQAVDIIEFSSKQATSAMESTRQSHESLHTVVEAISDISDNVRQVATAAEEQSAVSEEITRNLTVIGDAAQMLAELAQQANSSSNKVTTQLDRLDSQLSELNT